MRRVGIEAARQKMINRSRGRRINSTRKDGNMSGTEQRSRMSKIDRSLRRAGREGRAESELDLRR